MQRLWARRLREFSAIASCYKWRSSRQTLWRPWDALQDLLYLHPHPLSPGRWSKDSVLSPLGSDEDEASYPTYFRTDLQKVKAAWWQSQMYSSATEQPTPHTEVIWPLLFQHHYEGQRSRKTDTMLATINKQSKSDFYQPNQWGPGLACLTIGYTQLSHWPHQSSRSRGQGCFPRLVTRRKHQDPGQWAKL